MDDERSRDHHQNSPAETEWPVLVAAHEALRTAVLGVDPEAWDRPTPCDRWTVTQVLQHAVGDQLAYAAAITGQPGPTEDPFAPSGHLDRPAIGLLEARLACGQRRLGDHRPRRSRGPHPFAAWSLAGLDGRGRVRPRRCCARLGHRYRNGSATTAGRRPRGVADDGRGRHRGAASGVRRLRPRDRATGIRRRPGWPAALPGPAADRLQGPAGSCAGCNTASRSEPIGTPRPVHASQPGPALKAPLSPTVMSRKPGATSPAVAAAYSAGCRRPRLLPACCASRATSAAHSGATALVPPKTTSLPSTRTW